ncbi:FMN-binding protein [Candidatus Contubernalis alkalaceticus]
MCHLRRQYGSLFIESQTLQVDCISGATRSSKSILKAVENALSKTE